MADFGQTVIIDGREATYVPCPLCHSSEVETLFVRHQFAYQRCCRCQTVRVNPQLTAAAIKALYREGYESKSRFHAKGPLLIPSQQRRILAKLADIANQRGRLLDVGCFEGQFLRVAQALGWQVVGTEISTMAASFARETCGLDVRIGALETLSLPAHSFDAVTFHDVVEHLPQPVHTLAEAARVLRPGGALYIWTPNFDSLTRRLFLGQQWGAVVFPWHLCYFTPATLTCAIEQAGFELVSITTRNWLLDRRDRYLALQNRAGLPPRSPSVLRLHRLLDRVSHPFFAWASDRGWHLGAQIGLFARKNR